MSEETNLVVTQNFEWPPRSSDSLKNLGKARTTWRAQTTNPPRNGKANYGKYTTLDELLAWVHEEHDGIKGLSAFGLDLSFKEFSTRDSAYLVTTLTHCESGEKDVSCSQIGQSCSQQQKFAGDVTYIARRHIQGLLSLCGDSDLDGAHPGETTITKGRARPAAVRTKKQTTAQAAREAIANAGSLESANALMDTLAERVKEKRVTQAEYEALVSYKDELYAETAA